MAVDQINEMGIFRRADDQHDHHWVPGRIAIDDDRMVEIRVFSPETCCDKSLVRPGAPAPGKRRIVGITEMNKHIVVDDVSRITTGPLTSGLGSVVIGKRYISDHLLVRRVEAAGEPILFTGVQFSVDGLFEWLAHSGITADLSQWSQGGPVINLSYTPPDPIEFTLPDGIRGEIHLNFQNLEYPIHSSSTFELQQTALMSLTTEAEWDLNTLREILVAVQSFFCFATTHPVSVTKVKAWHREHTEIIDGQTRRARMDLYARSAYHRECNDEIAPHRMLFSYDDVAKDLTSVLGDWFEFYKANTLALNALMRDWYWKLTLEEHFLVLTRAFEAISRKVADRDRTQRAIKRLGQKFADDFVGGLNVEAFAKTVTENRNWYTHSGRSGTEQPPSSVMELQRMYLNLDALLMLYLADKIMPDGVTYKDALWKRDADGNTYPPWGFRDRLTPLDEHTSTA